MADAGYHLHDLGRDADRLHSPLTMNQETELRALQLENAREEARRNRGRRIVEIIAGIVGLPFVILLVLFLYGMFFG